MTIETCCYGNMSQKQKKNEEVVIFISNIQCIYGMMHGVFGQNGGVYTFATK